MVNFSSMGENKNWLKCDEPECDHVFHKDDVEGMKDHAVFHQLGPEQYSLYKGE